MQVDSNMVWTLTGLNLILKVRGYDEPRHPCNEYNLNSSSHSQLLKGVYTWAARQSLRFKTFPWHTHQWMNSIGKMVIFWRVHENPCICLLSLCMFEIFLNKQVFFQSHRLNNNFWNRNKYQFLENQAILLNGCYSIQQWILHYQCISETLNTTLLHFKTSYKVKLQIYSYTRVDRGV